MLFSFSFGFFLFLFYFFVEKKGDQIFYLSHYKAYIESSLSPLMRALPLVSKIWSIFIFHSQMGLAPSSKSLVNWFKKISSFNPHWALCKPTHVFGFWGFKIFPKHEWVQHLFNKAYNILMILGSLTFEKEFWILTKKLGYVMTLWPSAFLKSLCSWSWTLFIWNFFKWAQNLGYIMALWIIFHLLYEFCLLIFFLKKTLPPFFLFLFWKFNSWEKIFTEVFSRNIFLKKLGKKISF